MDNTVDFISLDMMCHNREMVKNKNTELPVKKSGRNCVSHELCSGKQIVKIRYATFVDRVHTNNVKVTRRGSY
jgi:hypothetical protein